MKVLSLFTASALLSMVGLCSAADDFVYGKDPKKDAEYDISMGMAGIQQAAKDPKLLAQLFQDMQDPELMAEARKMMESADWKKKMKELTNDKAFKSNMDNVKKTMEDPNEAAKMQAKMEHMMKTGNKELNNDAKDTMAQAMQAMADPTTMAEAARMMKDPQFQQQLAQMAKDPSFKKYVNAMQDMMQDPTTKRQMEQMADSFKAAL
mmetsp:Transcript_32302/g.62277  ORF Transcript_32302/g.62277 Transcript_32302/m.62277 type:complete len:207 (-) Transcript_32302:299-919(-)